MRGLQMALLGAALLTPTIGVAETPPPEPDEGQSAAGGATGGSTAKQARSADGDDKSKAEDADDKERFPKFVGAPIPMFNPQLQFGLGAIAMLVYKLDPEDKVSPPSSSTLFGFGTTNGSFLVAGAQQVHLFQDEWRGNLVLGYGRFNSDFYGTGDATGLGMSIPLGTSAFFLQPTVLKRAFSKFYVGARYQLMVNNVELDTPMGQIPDDVAMLFPLKFDETHSALGVATQFDLRNNRFSPTEGYYAEVTAMFFNGAFGGDADFVEVQAFFNGYHPIVNERYVLAWRAAFVGVTDSTPFYLTPAIGRGADLRGYSYGAYRDQFLMAAQTEFRWNFWWKLHAVAFLGLGTVAGPATASPPALPSYGGGLRFRVDDKQRLMIRFDLAGGLDGPYAYFGINEAF